MPRSQGHIARTLFTEYVSLGFTRECMCVRAYMHIALCKPWIQRYALSRDTQCPPFTTRLRVCNKHYYYYHYHSTVSAGNVTYTLVHRASCDRND